MRRDRRLAFVCCRSALLVLASVALLGGCGQKPPPPLWAGLAVEQPVFQGNEQRALHMHFTLVNQSPEPLKPEITDSKLYVNGEEMEESEQVFSSGRFGGYDAIKPGSCLNFEYYLGHYFQEPGIYEVVWKGKGFETTPVVFRIEPGSPGEGDGLQF